MSAESAVSPKREAASGSNPCPRCGKPLTDAAGLGWCPACGYCRSLEESQVPEPAKKKDAPAAKKPSIGGLVELGAAVGGLSSWVWIMAVGAVGFALSSLLPASQFPMDSLERAVWTTGQIGVGLALIFAAQFYAVVLIAPDDEKMSFKDVILPFRTWSQVCKRLPRTYLCAWLGSWGLSLIASALIIVGGLPYWMHYLPGGKFNNGKPQLQQRR
jgi:hypothetical protein